MIPLPYKLLGAALAVLAMVAAVLGYGRQQYAKGVQATTATYQAAIAQQKAQAATTLANETERVRLLERALSAATRQQETHDAQAQKTIADLDERLRNLAGPGLRLRDPNATIARCWGGGGSAPGAATAPVADRAANGPDAGGLLSVPLTELLRATMREADDINAAYASCRADAYAVRGQQAPL